MMNKKFIATFAAAAMLCCVCNAGVAVADDNTPFQTTITQLVNKADTHIDALKNIVNAQDDAELKKDLARDLKFSEHNKQKIQDARLAIEKFEQHLNEAGNNPDQPTLKALQDEYYSIEYVDSEIYVGSVDSPDRPAPGYLVRFDPFEGYSDYSGWLEEAMSYEAISAVRDKIAKLKTIKANIATFANSIKLPSEVNPANIDDECAHELEGVKLRSWHDGAENASNPKYVEAQLNYWREEVQIIKNRLKDKVTKTARGLATHMEYDLEGRIYQLTSKAAAALSLHDGEEYLKQQLKKYNNLEDVFRHNVTEYNDFGITQDQSSTPTKDPSFDYATYDKLQEQINTLDYSPSYKEFFSKFGNVDETKLDYETWEKYLEAFKKRIKIENQMRELRKKQKALGEYPKDYKLTADSRTARPGAISYAYLHLKFKKYVQHLLDQGTDLKQWLKDNYKAYRAIFSDRKKEFGNVSNVYRGSEKYPKYLESYFKQHRYEFIRDLVASREYKKYVKDELQKHKTYAEMIQDTEDSRRVTDIDTYNELGRRIRFIEHLQEYGNDDEVAEMLNTDDLALTPEQQSSESVAPVDYNNSSFDNFVPDYYRRKNHNTNPGGGSGNTNPGDGSGNTNPGDGSGNNTGNTNPGGGSGNGSGNDPDGNNPEGGNPGGGYNGGSAGGPTKDSGDDSDDFNWDDFNWDDLNLDDLNLDDLNLDDLNSKHTQPDNPQSKKNNSDNPQTNNTNVDDFNIDDFNIDDFDLDDLDLSDLDLSNFYNDNTQSNNAKPKKNKSENPQTNNTNVDDFDLDDFNIDDFNLDDLNWDDFNLDDFYNDDTQSDDTQSGKTKPEVSKTNVTNSEDTKPSGAQSDGAIDGEPGLADLGSVQFASYPVYYDNGNLTDSNNVGAQSDGAINNEPGLADLGSVQFASYPVYYDNGNLTDSNNAESK